MNKYIEVKNNSKVNLEKILTDQGKRIENNTIEKGLNNLLVFEDIFQYEDLPSSTVRLSASTIKQLFEDTKYSLKFRNSSDLTTEFKF